MSDSPPAITYAEPRSRTYRDWTPELLRSAEVRADVGDLALAAELVERMMADDRVKAVLDQRTDALVGLPLSFEAGLGRRKKQAVTALDAEEDWWAMCPESVIKQLLAWGLMLGVGLAEIVWDEPEPGLRVVPRLVVKHPRNLRWEHEKRRWLLRTEDQGDVPIVPGDGKWILLTPYGEHRPWAFGAYRALSRWCLLKDYAIDDWGHFSNRHGSGMIVVTGAGGTREERQQISQDLQTIGANAALALSPGFDIKLLEATANTWQTFQAQITACDNAAAVTLLGQNLSTEVSAGSQAAATVHGGVKLEKTKADAEVLATTLHGQLLTWWAEFNFGDRRLAPWPVWDTTPTEDLKARAAMVQQVAQAIATLVQARAPVDVAAMLESFGIATVAPEPEPQPAGQPQPAAAPQQPN